jgi:tripartite-type tricarboxylate transporter receptor subunit TctC
LVAALIALAKVRSGALNHTFSGRATPDHIAGAKFCHMAQIQVEHIAFRGSGMAQSAIMGSTFDWMFDTITA